MKTLILIIAVVMTAACSGEQTGRTYDGVHVVEGNARVVDAAEYFANVPKYEGENVYLFLRRVRGPEAKGKGDMHVSSFDGRDLSLFGILQPSKEILVGWLNAGMDVDGSYTVTFRVKAKDETGGKKAIYSIEFDKFIINSEDGALFNDVPTPTRLEKGLPASRATFPLAKIVPDFEKIALFPERYVDKRVYTSLKVFKSDVQIFDEKYWVVREGAINVLLPKLEVEAKLPSLPHVSGMKVWGELKSVGAFLH